MRVKAKGYNVCTIAKSDKHYMTTKQNESTYCETNDSRATNDDSRLETTAHGCAREASSDFISPTHSEHRAYTSRAFSNSGRMFSGVIASEMPPPSGSAIRFGSGLCSTRGPCHAGGGERSEPVPRAVRPLRDVGRFELGPAYDCRLLLRSHPFSRRTASPSSSASSLTSDSFVERVCGRLPSTSGVGAWERARDGVGGGFAEERET